MPHLGRIALVWLLCCGVALSEPPIPSGAPATPSSPTPNTPPPNNPAPNRPIAEPTVPEPVGVPQTDPAPQEPPATPANPNPPVTNPAEEPQTQLEPGLLSPLKKSDPIISNPTKPKPIPTPSKNSVSLESKLVLGVHVKLVHVNLENPKVRVLPVLPANAFRRGAQFDKLVSGSSAVAVLNAGYFHPRTFSPVGDLIYNGHYLARGRLRTGLAITNDNVVSLWLRPYAPNAKTLETLIGTGPLLVHGGAINPVPKDEGYTDPAIWGSAPRTAVGIISKKKLVFISTRERLSLRALARVMRALGARDAIALDGGSSVGFAWRGKVMIHPKRKIAFGVGVYIRR
jgi:uncharacterized protein YigE (DUF2233 family)